MHRVVAQANTGIAGKGTGWGFISIYAGAYVGTWLALLTPIMVTLALRARELAPATSEYSHSLVLAAGALCALFSNPIVGLLSDRTTSSWGMRRPWLIGGSIAGLASLGLVAMAPSVPWLVVGWCLAQISFNAVLAPLAALLPDHVPEARRGTVAGVVSICTPIGQVGGTYLTKAVAGDMTAMLMIPGVVCLVLVLVLAATLPDRRLARGPAASVQWRVLLASFRLRPSKAPDFAWVCSGRFFLIMSMSFLLAYQPFLLMKRLGIQPEDVPEILFRSTLVQSAAVVLTGLATGRLSDLVGRRKPFVIGAALICAVGSWLISVAASYDTFLAGVAVFGVGLGAYLSADLALVTDVLPNKRDDAGKDLGLFNVASTLAQSIAPAVASGILMYSGRGYGAVFVASAIVAALSAVLVLPIRAAR